MWAMNGIGYHLLFFAAINPAANLFGIIVILQALILAAALAPVRGIRFQTGRDFRSFASLSFVLYAMLIYPVLGVVAGHGMMAGPMFGVAPCPTTIFTIGMLLLAQGGWVVRLSIIPFLWSLVGLAAALQLGIPEDLGLPIVGVVLAVVLVVEAYENRRSLIALPLAR